MGATVAALDGLGTDLAPGRLVVILGGDGKGQDFAALRQPLQRCARAVALIGRDAPALQAVAWCFEQASAGDAVLLSPACASLDMFRSYAHRAEVFADAVRARALEHGEALG